MLAARVSIVSLCLVRYRGGNVMTAIAREKQRRDRHPLGWQAIAAL